MVSTVNFKDIDINKLSSLSDNFIVNHLSDSINLYDRLSDGTGNSIPSTLGITSENKEQVLEFIVKYIVSKYNQDAIDITNYDSYERDLVLIMSLYEMEKTIDSQLIDLNRSFKISRTKSSLDELIDFTSNKVYVLSKLNTHNRSLLLDNYSAKSNKLYSEYESTSEYSDNVIINIKNILNVDETDPTYITSFNQFSNYIFKKLSNSSGNLEDIRTDDVSVPDTSQTAFESINYSDIRIDQVKSLILTKYFSVDSGISNVISTHENRLKDLLVAKLTKKDEVVSEDISEKIIFNHSNLEQLFQSIDLTKDNFEVSYKNSI